VPFGHIKRIRGKRQNGGGGTGLLEEIKDPE